MDDTALNNALAIAEGVPAGNVIRELVATVRQDRRRLVAALDALQEARDAICALTTTQVKLHNISPSLAERMDRVGNRELWEQSELSRAD